MQLSRKSTTRKYTVNSPVFLNEDEISFYLLGVYMADGNVIGVKHRISFSLISKDKDWLKVIRDLICPNKPLYLKNNYECYTLSTSDIDSMNWLMSYGCVPRKSKTLKIEKPIPDNHIKDFIRGVVDGDGSISTCPYTKIKNGKEYKYQKYTVYICSASEIFLQQIKKMVPQNINCNICKVKQTTSVINGRLVIPTCDIYRLTFNDSNAKKLIMALYR